MSILLLWFCLDVSFGKIIFQPEKVYASSLVNRFVQTCTNPVIKNVKVINFGYDVANPEEFQILMKSLHDENHSQVTLDFSDFDKTVLHPWDRVFLLLLPNNHIREVFMFIDQISYKGLHSIKAIVLLNSDITKAEFFKLHEKPQSQNFDEIIYVIPAPPKSGVYLKVLYKVGLCVMNCKYKFIMYKWKFFQKI